MSAIDKIDAALGRYYKSLGQPYDRLFSNYCEENGLDDDTINEELQIDSEDCLLIDFDENFPFKKEPKNRTQAIFDMILKCQQNPHISFNVPHPTFDEDFFNVDEKDLENIKTTYQNQCPVLWNSGMSTDAVFLQILSIGRKNNFDYLLHLVDDYSRDRVKHIDEPNGWTEEQWSANHKHFQILKKLKVKQPKGLSSGKIAIPLKSYDELAMGAVYSFGKRCTPKLLFGNMVNINYSIQMTVKFIESSINFVWNQVHANKRILACPFQFDMCLAVGAPVVTENNVSVGADDDYVDDDSDDDDDIDDIKVNSGDSGNSDYVDCIGSIEQKIKKNKLKYKFSVKDVENPRLFREVFKEFADEHKLQGKDDKITILHEKRLIAFVDTRDENTDFAESKVFMYEPPKNCRDFPFDHVPEWCISASRTCILPNMNYGDGSRAVSGIKIEKEEKIDNVTKLKNSNIGASFHAKGGILTFSYYIKEKNVMKCYMFWNGQIIRFMPEDIKTVLPKIFNMKYGSNRDFIEKNKELQEQIKEMKKKLVDKEFEAFQQSYL